MTAAIASQAVYHREPNPAPHDCRERLKETCAICKGEYVLCRATQREANRIMAGVWTDAECARRWRRW